MSLIIAELQHASGDPNAFIINHICKFLIQEKQILFFFPFMVIVLDSGPPLLGLAKSIYSCFEKGCPTKPYATMPKGIMGNGGLWYLIEALGVSAT